MTKSRSISVAAVLAVGLIAGCGSSGNKTSAWTKADVAELESGLASGGVAAGPLRTCVTKFIESRLSPADARSKGPSGAQSFAKEALASCDQQTSSSSVDHASEWSGAKTQELENLLTAQGVTNMSCYVKFVESRIGPLEYTSSDKAKSEQVGREAAANCHPTESKEEEERLEEEHKIKEEATSPAQTPGASEEP